MKYLEPMFAESALAGWAREKFEIVIDPKEFIASDKGGRVTKKTTDEMAELIQDRVRAAYTKRETEYPAEHMLYFVFRGDDNGTHDPNAIEFVSNWSKAKYGVELPLSEFQGKGIRKLRDRLVELQAEALKPENIERVADQVIKENPTPEQLATTLSRRFGLHITQKDLMGGVQPGKSEAPVPDADSDGAITMRDTVVRAVRSFLRKELTDLEQFVLIQILDQSWKDHLYAMDMLRNSIGLQAFAERDPRVLYKKEGYRYFEEMMVGIRDKATDLVFRARLGGLQQQTRSAYNVTSETHEETGGYGVAENLPAMAAGEPGQAQGGEGEEAAPVKTIVREAEKVGRNDPCPCGSGKKYKKCCGANVA
jgi:preprotein translocase subunit SecA